jgi:hypothetical protein
LQTGLRSQTQPWTQDHEADSRPNSDPQMGPQIPRTTADSKSDLDCDSAQEPGGRLRTNSDPKSGSTLPTTKWTQTHLGSLHQPQTRNHDTDSRPNSDPKWDLSLGTTKWTQPLPATLTGTQPRPQPAPSGARVASIGPRCHGQDRPQDGRTHLPTHHATVGRGSPRCWGDRGSLAAQSPPVTAAFKRVRGPGRVTPRRPAPSRAWPGALLGTKPNGRHRREQRRDDAATVLPSDCRAATYPDHGDVAAAVPLIGRDCRGACRGLLR